MQGLALFGDQTPAVDIEPAAGNLVDDGGGSGGQPHHVAVPWRHGLGDADVLRQIGVLGQVTAHAVGRYGDLRPRPGVHLAQFLAARVARDVDAGVIALGVEAHPAVSELVLQPADRQLIAGDDPRREDAVIALAQLDVGVGALGHARQGRPRLALAAGAQIQDLVGWPDAGLLFRQEGFEIAHHADMFGGRGDAVHRPPRQRHAPSRRLGRADHAVHARDIGGETADRDPPLQSTDQLCQGVAHRAFRPRRSLDEDIGGIAHHGQHAVVAEAGDGPGVGDLADDRIVVDLPVAGVQHRAQRRLDGQAVRLGDRMGHGDEGDVERSQLNAAAQRHLDQLDLVQDSGLAKLLADQEGGEGRGVQRRLHPAPQPAQSADMVLMRVGQDDAADRLAFQEGGIWHDHIDAGRRQVAEGHAHIDHDPLAVRLGAVAVQIQVHTDFARPAQRQEDEFVVGFLFHASFRWCSAARFRGGRG